jgi:hypothetical protein
MQESKRRSSMVRATNLALRKSSIEVSLSQLSSQSSVPSSNTVVLDEGTELCNDNGLRVTSIELFLEARLVARTILERRLLSWSNNLPFCPLFMEDRMFLRKGFANMVKLFLI